MLNSPVFSGLCQPRPIYIKGLIPSTAHFSAPWEISSLLIPRLQGLSSVRKSLA